MTLAPPGLPSAFRVPIGVQLVAWIAGLGACVAGMINLVAEWNLEMATAQFLLIVLAPVFWMFERRRTLTDTSHQGPGPTHVWATVAATFVGLTSLMTCAYVGWTMVDLPPAYHDEYSYLFQAKAILRGTFSVPSHPVIPELFNQMHVLNEGRMASRYYPGTGFWLAPFVAMEHPYWGHWLATSIASVFVFWTGYELGRLRTAIFSGLAFAVSPGVALFGNLLLAHQPTLLGLSFFLWAFTKWSRSRLPRQAFFAGCGLSFAMISRPATAAAFGFPFGLALFYWLLFPRQESSQSAGFQRFRVLVSIGMPLVVGWVIMLAYNQSATGSWRTSPYQLYTEIYTPRHVYGFNNVLNGGKKVGPKVIEAYDRWAKNLTPELAATNLFDRWFASWLWTFDLLPLLMSSVVVAGMLFRIDRRWMLICCSILSIHAIHIPYWYTGIMGWHYVFETAPLWCLLLGLSTDLLVGDWRVRGRWMMPGWWILVLLLSVAGNYLPFQILNPKSSQLPRVDRGISSIRYPRYKYAEFDRWLNESMTERPAIVLIEVDPDDTHVDYVTNSPEWNQSILRARYVRGVTDLQKVIEAFPDRNVYLCQPRRKSIELLNSIRPSTSH